MFSIIFRCSNIVFRELINRLVEILKFFEKPSNIEIIGKKINDQIKQHV